MLVIQIPLAFSGDFNWPSSNFTRWMVQRSKFSSILMFTVKLDKISCSSWMWMFVECSNCCVRGSSFGIMSKNVLSWRRIKKWGYNRRKQLKQAVLLIVKADRVDKCCTEVRRWQKRNWSFSLAHSIRLLVNMFGVVEVRSFELIAIHTVFIFKTTGNRRSS